MIILKTDKLKEIASKVAMGVDGDRTSPLSELLELELKNKELTLKTTNKEFFLKTILSDITDSEEELHITINADVFLSLINKITTNTIKLEITKEGLELYGNGKYTFPLFLDGEESIRLPEIPFNVDESTVSFEISGDILKSIYDFNSKELTKDQTINYIQRHYYFDEFGALTYVENACINEFKLPQPVKLLFNERLVQLFKLFAGKEVKFSWNKKESGVDEKGNIIYQNKVKFDIEGMELTSIVPHSDLVERYPVIALRNLVEIEYPGQVKIAKQGLQSAIERLFIFDKLGINRSDLKKCGKLEFKDKELIITNTKDKNFEIVPYIDQEEIALNYTLYISLADLLKHVNISSQNSLSILYGTEDAIVIQRDNLKQVIPPMTDPTDWINSVGN